MCVCVCVWLKGGQISPGGTVVKNLPMDAGDARDVGLIPCQDDHLEWGAIAFSEIYTTI